MHSILTPRSLRFGKLAGAVLAATAALDASAADLGGVAVHGSLSSTASYSPEYNYLGDTKDSLDLNQIELILNGTKRFDNGIKLAAQIYAYELAGYEDLSLDFANLDYSFNQAFGVRVGRNKIPLGLYTESQDLDQVRVFASLPLSFYPKALRAFGAFYDGLSIYGSVGAGKAGSLDYQAYIGRGSKVDEDHPFMRGLGATALDGKALGGTSLFWNTPVEGLRVGYSMEKVPEATLDFGPGLDTELDYETHVFSAEYTRDKWLFAAEYKINKAAIDFSNPFIPDSSSTDNLAYGQVSYQATDKLGLGVYYARSDYDNGDKVDDIALAASYAIQPWWLVKAEIHAIDGIHFLGDAGDLNPGATDETWSYLVLKTTVSF